MLQKLLGGCLFSALLSAVVLFLAVWVTATFVNPRTPSNTDIAGSALLASPPPALAEPATLTLVTYNIQSLFVVGRNRPARMVALGKQMIALDPDIVCWQEVFIHEDRALLLESLEGSRLIYHEYFPSATMGSGLMISSAFPIRETLFLRYTASNPWYKVYEGDWWAGKGAGLARIELPDAKGVVDVYNTHAQAGYGNAAYDLVRLEQMRELATFMHQTNLPTAPAFLLGDMNARLGRNAGYELIVKQASLERLLLVDSSIDHIFGVIGQGYSFEVEESWELDWFEGVRMSDHRGYASRIRILPVDNP